MRKILKITRINFSGPGHFEYFLKPIFYFFEIRIREIGKNKFSLSISVFQSSNKFNDANCSNEFQRLLP